MRIAQISMKLGVSDTLWINVFGKVSLKIAFNMKLDKTRQLHWDLKYKSTTVVKTT